MNNNELSNITLKSRAVSLWCAVHCGDSKWRLRYRCHQESLVICSYLLQRFRSTFTRNILLSLFRKNAIFVFRSGSVHLRRLSGCLRQKLLRPVYVREVPVR